MTSRSKVSPDLAGSEIRRKVKGAQVARAPEASRRLAKEPSERQYVVMVGAMSAALERLRVFHQTMVALKPLAEDLEVVLLHESEKKILLSEIEVVMNALRIGLKARVRR